MYKVSEEQIVSSLVVKDNVRSPNIRTCNIDNVSSIVISWIPLQLRVDPALIQETIRVSLLKINGLP